MLRLRRDLSHAPATARSANICRRNASPAISCRGRFDGIPPIVGWPETNFVEIMNEYRDKKRDNAVMQTIAARLSDDEIAALAAYFGSVQPEPP